jgi:hypothetical protein
VFRNVLMTLAIACATLVTSAVSAQTRVVVRPFYGPGADAVRQEIENNLEHRPRMVIVSSKEADITAKKLSVDANSPEGRKVVATDLRVSAWVEGIVQKRGKKLRLTVLVYDGANHDRIARTVLTQKTQAGLMADLKRQFWPKSKDAISHARAPGQEGSSSSDGGDTAIAADDSSDDASDEAEASADESSDDSSADSDEEETEVADATPAASDEVRSTSSATVILPSFMPTVESASASAAPKNDAAPVSDSNKKHPEALRAIFGIGSPYRNLAYSDIVTQKLGNYELTGAPMFDVRVAFHPGSYMTSGWGSWIGLDLRTQFAIGIKTVDTDGNKFKSSYNSYHAGVLAKIPAGRHFVRGHFGYAAQSFLVKSQSKTLTSPTPNVSYRMLRMGLGTDLAVTNSIAMGIDASWLQVLDAGQIGDWFPRAQVAGVEFGLAATYALSPRFFARAFGMYQRMFFDFNSKPTDKRIAGGATDNYLTAGLGLGVSL